MRTRCTKSSISERVSRRLVERIDLGGDDDPADDDQDETSASRGETAAGEDREQPVPAVPTDAEPAPPTPPVALPCQHAGTLLGPGGDLVGWSRALGLFYVRKDGRALGWIEHGASRVNGWAVPVAGTFLVDSTAPGRPLACDTADAAALLVRQALDQSLIDAVGLVCQL
ncbi:hypothetical protein ACH4E7_32230 [Kitasatospora sp. NPDC018058]|uniref:hypothetical protein n=1 Tax=Kitasatospora sp. NPDC018058 TaxID=3364025 RepID=UPI0037BFD366